MSPPLSAPTLAPPGRADDYFGEVGTDNNGSRSIVHEDTTKIMWSGPLGLSGPHMILVLFGLQVQSFGSSTGTADMSGRSRVRPLTITMYPCRRPVQSYGQAGRRQGTTH